MQRTKARRIYELRKRLRSQFILRDFKLLLKATPAVFAIWLICTLAIITFA